MSTGKGPIFFIKVAQSPPVERVQMFQMTINSEVHQYKPYMMLKGTKTAVISFNFLVR